MLIENRGIRTDAFYISPFTLNVGELVVLNLFNGPHFYETEMLLKDIFSCRTKDKNVVVHQKLTFVEHFKEPKLRRLLYPVTVGEYLEKNANSNSPYANKIYEINWIKPQTKLNTLAGNPRRLLALYATLSITEKIIFDVVGQDPKGARATYEVVSHAVDKGGAAILLDSSGDFRDRCTKYIEIQWKNK